MSILVYDFAHARTTFSDRPLENCVHIVTAPETAKLHWRKVRTLESLELCLPKVGKHLNGVELAAIWLQLNGFQVAPSRAVSLTIMFVNYKVEGEGARLVAGVGKEGMQIRLGLVDGYFVHGMTAGLLFDQDFNPVSSSATLTRL